MCSRKGHPLTADRPGHCQTTGRRDIVATPSLAEPSHMEQTRFGKKVQNWHRPLGPSQLRRRFLQRRDADLETIRWGQPPDNFARVYSTRDYWGRYSYPVYGDNGGPEDIYHYFLDHLLQNIVGTHPSLIPLEWAVEALVRVLSGEPLFRARNRALCLRASGKPCQHPPICESRRSFGAEGLWRARRAWIDLRAVGQRCW